MKSLNNFILFIKWPSLVLSFSIFATSSFAAVDITERILIEQSSLQYEPDTQTSYMDVSVKNISKNIIPSPFKVIIEDISNPSVSVRNPDGNINGKPYFKYTAYGGVLSAGDQTEKKRWEFSNPEKHRFTLRLSSHFSDETTDIYWRFPTASG